MRSSLNLCDLPPWRLASLEYNDAPEPIEVQGVRRANRFLFERLDATPDPVDRAHIFHDYMSVKFHLHEQDETHTPRARKSIRNSYLRFVRGWGVDSNSVEAAVLKGWVESRIGLAPTFHRGKVLSDDAEDQMAYAVDRMKGSARTNAILSQFDVLFAFCQYELARRMPGETWISLYRGTYDADAYETISVAGPRERVIRLNNLSSFTSDPERAWEFGSTVWEARIPVFKTFFYSKLLPDSILKGEDEYLVIGGECRVRVM